MHAYLKSFVLCVSVYVYLCGDVGQISHLNNNLAGSTFGYFQIVHNQDKLKHKHKTITFPLIFLKPLEIAATKTNLNCK